MWCRMALIRTDISERSIVSIIRVKWNGEIGTLALTSTSVKTSKPYLRFIWYLQLLFYSFTHIVEKELPKRILDITGHSFMTIKEIFMHEEHRSILRRHFNCYLAHMIRNYYNYISVNIEFAAICSSPPNLWLTQIIQHLKMIKTDRRTDDSKIVSKYRWLLRNSRHATACVYPSITASARLGTTAPCHEDLTSNTRFQQHILA
jgi:hypothetical protein